MKIGFIGLGTMGAPMAHNLIKAGFDVTVHNRTREREEPLVRAGADQAATPADAARGADVVITMLSDTPDVEGVLFDDNGVASTAQTGSTVIDMSTISGHATRNFGARLQSQRVKYVDAPVSGGSEGATNGTLTIMCGGKPEDVEAVRPVLEAMGSKVTHVGPLGSGQLTKAVNQIIISGTFAGLAEGLVFGMKNGLDMEKVVEALGSGMARSAIFEMRSGNMLNDDYPLGFKLSLHRKDLGIALESGLDLPVAKLVAEIEDALLDEHGDEDMSVIAKDIRRRVDL